jgi:hypothetical protein
MLLPLHLMEALCITEPSTLIPAIAGCRNSCVRQPFHVCGPQCLPGRPGSLIQGAASARSGCDVACS